MFPLMDDYDSTDCCTCFGMLSFLAVSGYSHEVVRGRFRMLPSVSFEGIIAVDILCPLTSSVR